jgi:hypothetical protein
MQNFLGGLLPFANGGAGLTGRDPSGWGGGGWAGGTLTGGPPAPPVGGIIAPPQPTMPQAGGVPTPPAPGAGTQLLGGTNPSAQPWAQNLFRMFGGGMDNPGAVPSPARFGSFGG